jgi:transposase
MPIGNKFAVSDFSARDFFERFPNDEACLDYIMGIRFGGSRFECGACRNVCSHHKLARRRTYVCSGCGNHVNPTAGTALHSTRTPLISWFFAAYLFSRGEKGVSAKELQRQLGVTYKTAHRICYHLRTSHMGQEIDALLSKQVEESETYIGQYRHKVASKRLGSKALENEGAFNRITMIQMFQDFCL